jgi:hypothetical protein
MKFFLPFLNEKNAPGKIPEQLNVKEPGPSSGFASGPGLTPY